MTAGAPSGTPGPADGPIWTPDPAAAARAAITRFAGQAGRRAGLDLSRYRDLHAWSVKDLGAFWGTVADFFQLGLDGAEPLADERMPGASWFPGTRLNFAARALRHGTDGHGADRQGADPAGAVAVAAVDESGATTSPRSPRSPPTPAARAAGPGAEFGRPPGESLSGKRDRGGRRGKVTAPGIRADRPGPGRDCPIVSTVRTRSQDHRKLAVESAAFGLGYTAVLIWAGSALVGSFSFSGGDANPYWPAIPHLRTDTAGVIAFTVAIVSLTVSKYLQLRRRGTGSAEPAPAESAPVEPAPAALAARPAGVHAVQAVAETAVILSTGLVIYLSLNAVTHPVTLTMQLTHLAPGPSEGTVRVIALGICLVAVAVRRYLRATTSRPGLAAAVREKAGVAA
jgi:hypothetical protein